MWDRLEESDCALVEDPLWRDECVFLLAERRYAAGELASAIQTCHRTRFGRKCSWHLLQDLAQATLDRPPTEVESMLTPFLEADPMPDFKDQFWRIRFREQGAAGRTLDESACVGLVDEMSCESAVHYHVRSILDALAKTGLERTCERPMGQRATVADGAAWSLGAITEDAENQWVQQRCEVRRPPHP
jgi:hypothetical protein